VDAIGSKKEMTVDDDAGKSPWSDNKKNSMNDEGLLSRVHVGE